MGAVSFDHAGGGIEDAAERERLTHVAPTGWRNPKARPLYDLLVVGAGPAGMVAARAAAKLGARVALVERHQLGGDSLNYGSIPTKALIRTARLYSDMRCAATFGAKPPRNIDVDFRAAMARLQHVRARVSRTDSALCITRSGVELFFGHARFAGPDVVDVDGVTLRFRKAMIATGCGPHLPMIPGLAEAGYLTNANVFDIEALPASILVIGGGPLGCELAQVFARFGTRTIISHREPLFLRQEERDAAQMVSDGLARDGVEIHLNTEITSVRTAGGRKVAELVNDGHVTTTTVDEILTGIGRRPAVQGLDLEAAGVRYDMETGIHVDDFLRTSNPPVYAAGDVCLVNRFTNTAKASAEIVIRNALLLGRSRLSALTVPWCTYTDPEVAHVGLYVRQARERGIPVKTYTIPMHDVDRAMADSEDDGFVKIHVREGSGHIPGATVVARHAGEMINVVSLAMVAGIDLGALESVIYAYPTQGEAIRMAAEAYGLDRPPTWRHRLARDIVRLTGWFHG